MSHLTFNKKERRKNAKTDIYDIINKQNEIIGWILWRPGWRQYIFSPEQETNWSWDCLKEVSDFIKQLMEERKKCHF